MAEEKYIVIRTDVNIHLYPVAYFTDFANALPVDPMPFDVMRAIVRDWLITAKRYQKAPEVEQRLLN